MNIKASEIQNIVRNIPEKMQNEIPSAYFFPLWLFFWECGVFVNGSQKICLEKNLFFTQRVSPVPHPWFHYWNVKKR
jgi:hypothetical protein